MSIDRYRDFVTEEQMTHGIAELVKLRGGRLWHLRDARRSPELEDLPDLIIVCPPIAGLLELKSARRKVTRGQQQVEELLGQCDRLIGGIVRPRDYDDLLAALKGETS